jgi:hypothetical protein
MSGGGKTQTSTSSVQIPPEVLARYNAVNARAENVASTPFQAYSYDPSAFVAPMTETQNAAIGQIGQASGMAQPYFQTGAAATLGGMGPANLGELDTNKYMSPYLQNVVQSTADILGQQNRQDMSGALGTAIQSGAGFGDRSGIAAANLNRQQMMGMGSTIGNLLNQGYMQAQGVAQQQQSADLAARQANLARLLQGGQSIGQLGAGAQGAALAGSQALLGAGTQQQQTEQAGLSALYNQYQQERAYPFQTTQFLGNIGMGTGALSGATTTETKPAGFFSGLKRGGKVVEGVGYRRGGIVPESMGGHVSAGHMGEGYADGGSPQMDYASMVIQQLFGGMDPNAGAYGRGSAGIGSGGFVPQANLPVGQLNAPKISQSAPQTSISDLVDTGGKLYEGAENVGKWWEENNPSPPVIDENDPQFKNWDRAAGGRTTRTGLAAGGMPYDPQNTGYVPDNAPKETPELLQPKGPSQTQSGLSKVADIAKIVGAFMANGGVAGRHGYAGGGRPEPLTLDQELLEYARRRPASALFDPGPQNLPPGPFSYNPSQQSLPPGGITVPTPRQEVAELARQKAAAAEAEFRRQLRAAPSNLAVATPAGLSAADAERIRREHYTSVYKTQPVERILPTAGDMFRRSLEIAPENLAVATPAGLSAADAEGIRGEYYTSLYKTQPVERFNAFGTPVPAGAPADAGAIAATDGGLKPAASPVRVVGAQPAATEFPIAPSWTLPEVTAIPTAAAETPDGLAGAALPAPTPEGPADLTSGVANAAEPIAGAEPGLAAGTGAGTPTVATGDREAYYAAIKAAESGNNPNAQSNTSSASGYYGFTDGTWSALAQKYPEAGLTADGKNDPAQQERAIRLLTAENERQLKNAGIPATNGNLYAAHFLGAGAAPRVLSAPDGAAIEGLVPASYIAANPFLKGMTVGEFKQWTNEKSSGGGGGGVGTLGDAAITSPDVTDTRPDGGRNDQPAPGLGGKNFFEKMIDKAGGPENIILPFLSGLGKMAGSQSRFLGTAILEGVGGGAEAYMKRQEQLANIGMTEATTRGIDIENVKKSLQVTAQGNIMWTVKGPMNAVEYFRLREEGKAPETLGYIPGQPDQSGTNAPSGEAVTPRGTELPAGINFGDKSMDFANNEPLVANGLTGGAGYELALEATKTYQSAVTGAAAAARDTDTLTSDMAVNLADVIASDPGILSSPGAGFDVRANIASILNTTARAFKLDLNFSQADEQADISKKMQYLFAASRASGADQSSNATFEALAAALPNPNMPPEAIAELTASMLVNNQRSKARQWHMNKYKQNSGGFLADAGFAFNQDNPATDAMQAKEAIKNFMLKDPDIFAGIMKGKYTAQDVDEMFQQSVGIPGMSGYLMGNI